MCVKVVFAKLPIKYLELRWAWFEETFIINIDEIPGKWLDNKRDQNLCTFGSEKCHLAFVLAVCTGGYISAVT